MESIDPSLNSSQLWNKINRLTGKNRKKLNNNIIIEDDNLANQFLDKHFGKSQFVIVEGYYGSVNYNIMNLTKFNNILTSKNTKSAPGEDKISYDMLRALSNESKISIIKEINKNWRNCTLPLSLKTIKIVAIPKPGKDQTNIDGIQWRPISLVPTITKIINSAVLEKLQHAIETNNIIPNTSFGFRKNSSTITCTNFVINTIKQNKREGFLTAVIFLDLSNAFNKVDTNILEQIMNNNLIPLEIVNWVTNFLKNRKIIFKTRNGSIERFVSNGLPQGDVLSPTLFNVYTAQLHNISNGDVVLVQFADDFGLIIKAKNLEELNHKAQQAVDNLSSEMEKLKFTVNPEKTKAILFQNSNNILNIKIDNQLIETVRHHTYLGITLDRFLSFGAHIKQTKNKINERLNMLKVISGIKNGSHPQTMITIYQSLIRSTAEYGASIFNNSKKTNRKTLQTATNSALRRITGCTRSTPLNIWSRSD